MNNNRLIIILSVLMAITIIVIRTVTANAELEIITTNTDEDKIQTVIQAYFDRRYRARAINQIVDFVEFTDGSSQTNPFIKSEKAKLEIEIHNSKKHNLGYSDYEFKLDFNNIAIDKANQSATVSLTEGHDVIFEISALLYKDKPIISRMRNLSHTIILRNSQNGWKIVSDYYDDDLWHVVRSSNLSKEGWISMIDLSEDMRSSITGESIVQFSCNLPDDESSHPYNRSGAYTYAHQYALTPNPDYYYFPGNDCTNFVNQAIHHGSNAEEVGSNTFGWYYNYYNDYLDNDYSASWTDVQKLYEFITQYYVWDKGPEGCDVNEYYALPGDLVQFEWDDGRNEWDHSVIIVQKGTGGYGVDYWVAAHSEDVDNYPLDAYISKNRRFIHIERIDGGSYSVNVPLVMKDLQGSLMTIDIEPYPPPIEQGVPNQQQIFQNSYPTP